MKKTKLLLSVITIPTLGTCFLPLAGCKNNSPIGQQCTITFAGIDGVTLSGSTSITVKKGSFWSEIEKPKASFDESKLIYDAGWFDQVTQQYLFRLGNDFEINRDMTLQYHIITQDNNTEIRFVDTMTQSALFKHYVLKGSTWKAVKSLLDDAIVPESIEDYSFVDWMMDGAVIADDFIFDGVSVDVRTKWEWIGPTIEFIHSKGVSWKGVPKEKIEVHEPVKWSILKSSGKVPEPELDEGYYELGWWNANDKTPITDDTVIGSDFKACYSAFPKKQTEQTITVHFYEKIYKKSSDTNSITIEHSLPFAVNTASGDPLHLSDFIEFYQLDKGINVSFNQVGYYSDPDCTEKIEDISSKVFTDGDSNNFYFKLQLKDFCSADWKDVVDTAKTGIVGLKEKYKETSFIGLEKEIQLGNHAYRVRVIGQEHDVLTDGKTKAPLTFELVELISGNGSGNKTLTPLTTPLSWDDTGCLSGKNIDHVLNQESGTVCWYENGSTTPSTTYNKSCLYMGRNSDDEGTKYLFNNLRKVHRDFKKISTNEQGNDRYVDASFNTFLFAPNIAEISGDRCHLPCGRRYEYYVGLGRKDFAKQYLDPYLKDDDYTLVEKPVAPKYWMFQSDGAIDIMGRWCQSNIGLVINESGVSQRFDCKVNNKVGISFCFCI